MVWQQQEVTGLHFQLAPAEVNSIAVNELLGVNRRGLRLTRGVEGETHNTLLPRPPGFSPSARSNFLRADPTSGDELSHN